MKRYQTFAVVLGYAFPLIAALVFLGCEVDSSDSVTRSVDVDFTGVYDSTATDNDFVSPANSGDRVTSLNLRQSGDQLEAIDNNGIVFNGTLSDSTLSSGTATANFRLDGRTTAGQSVTISGSLSGTDTSGIMRGTWIEPSLFAYVYGDAVINRVPTNQPGLVTNVVAISPVGPITLNGTESQIFTASGGSETFTSWSISNTSLGTLSSSSGATTTYQRNSSASTGTNILTVQDSAGATASVTIIQP